MMWPMGLQLNYSEGKVLFDHSIIIHIFTVDFSGKWFGILNLVNTIGVITNGFLIGFTSSWAYNFDTATKLTIVLGFEVW